MKAWQQQQQQQHRDQAGGGPSYQQQQQQQPHHHHSSEQHYQAETDLITSYLNAQAQHQRQYQQRYQQQDSGGGGGGGGGQNRGGGAGVSEPYGHIPPPPLLPDGEEVESRTVDSAQYSNLEMRNLLPKHFFSHAILMGNDTHGQP